MLFRLPNPITAAIQERHSTNYVPRKYLEWRLLPQYGDTFEYGRAVVGLLSVLTEHAPTYRAAIGDMKTLSFGNAFEVAKKSFPGLRLQVEEMVSDAEALVFASVLGDLGVKLVSLLDVCKQVEEHLTANGNAYVRIIRAREGGQTFYKIGVVHYLHCAYGENEAGVRVVIVSQWLDDEEEMKKKGALLFLPTQVGDGAITWNKIGGVEQAIVHVRAEGRGSVGGLFQRSPMVGFLPQLYTDYQMGVLSSKIAGTDLVTKKILAFEGPDPNSLPEGDDPGGMPIEVNSRGDVGASARGDYFQRNMLVLRELTTNLGRHPAEAGAGRSASSLGAIEYPHGSEPPVEINLEVNRDTAYHTFQSEKAASIICAALGWALELTSIRQAKATLGGNLLRDMFVLKNEVTVKPKQQWYENFLTWLVDAVLIDAGKSENPYMLRFENSIEDIVKAISAGSTGGTNEAMVNEDENSIEDDDNTTFAQ